MRVESPDKYRSGGYYPALVGDTLKERYQIVDKLGHGSYSTIWLARDTQKEVYVALKINTADFQSNQTKVQSSLFDSCYLENIGWSMIPILQDHFKTESPNGGHECYVTSPARISVANSVERGSSFSVEVARSLVAQLIHAVAYIHNIHIGNILIDITTSFDSLSIPEFYCRYGEPVSERLERCDEGPITPGVPTHITEPILLGKIAHKFTVPEARLLLSDFGEAFSFHNQKEPKLGKDCHSPRYCLPPEAYFEPDKPLSFLTDTWTLVCAIWNIVTGYQLFSCFFPDSDEVTAQHIQILGDLPPEWSENWKAKDKYFDEYMQPKHEWEIAPLRELFFDSMEKTQEHRKKYSTVEMKKDEATGLLDMLESMLAYRPELRASISTVLNSDWMAYWGPPSYEVRHHKVDSWLPLSTAVS
ncbi:protein kinase-like protein [Penicillium malachiteum]|uniref:protein kinase-like protein n=1 Tax=Penicillium malachiteum TaxID=1324776 RepID=UPI00254727CE|nr:protein kinase-like protein [Penicillium malachiteum]KAJ5713534.1 protein kinase-like protein [Penicillium malachiteum]